MIFTQLEIDFDCTVQCTHTILYDVRKKRKLFLRTVHILYPFQGRQITTESDSNNNKCFYLRCIVPCLYSTLYITDQTRPDQLNPSDRSILNLSVSANTFTFRLLGYSIYNPRYILQRGLLFKSRSILAVYNPFHCHGLWKHIFRGFARWATMGISFTRRSRISCTFISD